jgi:hypothetical protein
MASGESLGSGGYWSGTPEGGVKFFPSSLDRSSTERSNQDFVPHPGTDMNASMDEDQRRIFNEYMRTPGAVIDTLTGEVTFPDQPISVQSVEEAHRLRTERENNLGD